MIVGCGLSSLGAYLYEQGFHYITNIDISRVAIDYMSEKHSHLKDMDYAVMDITQEEMSADTGPETFNFVIDKGTLDSLVCAETNKVSKMLENVHSLLMPRGIFVCVSRASPDMRMGYLQEKGLKWTVETIKINKVQLPNGQQ